MAGLEQLVVEPVLEDLVLAAQPDEEPAPVPVLPLLLLLLHEAQQRLRERPDHQGEDFLKGDHQLKIIGELGAKQSFDGLGGGTDRLSVGSGISLSVRVGSIHYLLLLLDLPRDQLIQLLLYLEQLLRLRPQLPLVLLDCVVLEDVDSVLLNGSEEDSS